MPAAEFEPAIKAISALQIYALHLGHRNPVE